MKRQEIVPNVGSYKLYDNMFIHTYGSGLMNERLFINNKLTTIDGVADYFFFNGEIYYTRWNRSQPNYGDNDTFVYDIITGKERIIENLRILRITDQYLVFKDPVTKIYEYKKYNFESICSSKYSFYAIQEEYGYTYTETQIMKVNFKDETIWSFSLESLAGSEHAPGERDSIEEVLGIAHGNLWFSSKFGRLVVLNIENGQVVKIISGNPYDRQLSLYDMTVGLGYCYLRSTDKNIISINGYEFQIIDTKIQKVIELYNYVECDPSGLGTYRSVFYPFLQGDYFTFVGQKEGEYGSCGWAGIYDYKARKLVWECEIVPEAERQKTGNQLVPGNHLYISGNKLYIKDIQDNLHIFEKDE